MDKSKRNLIILAVIMGVIWVSLLFSQIHLTERVFYSYKQIFQNKLDTAVDDLFKNLERHPFESVLYSQPDTEQHDGNYHSFDTKMIDSLISITLHENYIYEPFKIACYCENLDSFYYVSENVDVKQLVDKGFRYNYAFISPSGEVSNVQLFLFFPNLEHRFHWDIVIAYVVIILLLLILLYCFIVFLIIIIRQRKINDFRLAMLNNITHELKTPITTINLASQLLQDKSVMKDETAFTDYQRIIAEESNSLLGLIDEVLTVFRAEGMPVKEQHELSIHPLIKDVVNKFQLQLNQINAVVNYDFQASDDVVLGDRDHLLNGFSNLIDNAIKYRNGDLVITISTKNVGNVIEIQFADNGIGIDKANQSLIFEPFARVNTENKHYVKGYGLGLNYLSQIVKYHKGTIKLESELGNGARFFVYLPLKTK